MNSVLHIKADKGGRGSEVPTILWTSYKFRPYPEQLVSPARVCWPGVEVGPAAAAARVHHNRVVLVMGAVAVIVVPPPLPGVP